ncbi:FeoA family protein [Xylophilus rhododendri]|uniref:FeoA family protein n=1 Tax=Xylophilus rhododendri TaxID=2697032 RepID=UPI001E40AF79|nr:FeoA family protein [Xylophilus rhododendri]
MSAVTLPTAPSSPVLPASGQTLSLARLARHTPAVVVELRSLGQVDDAERMLRLSEIGFVPGEPVRVIAYGFPGREPIAVRIGRSTFALRAHEAALVQVVLA